jgi:hypothetical protein
MLAKRTEDEFRTYERIAEDTIGAVTRGLEDPPPDIDPQHENSKSDLQPQAPRHRFDSNRPAIRGKGKGQTEHR